MTARPALLIALRTGFVCELLEEAFRATRTLVGPPPSERGLAGGEPARGLGKLLVMAPDQRSTRRNCVMLQRWLLRMWAVDNPRAPPWMLVPTPVISTMPNGR